jgi:hypothetical protein
LVPVRKQPGLKAGAFSPALLVPVVATTGTNGRYKPGPMAFFPPVRASTSLPRQDWSQSASETPRGGQFGFCLSMRHNSLGCRDDEVVYIMSGHDNSGSN